MRDQATTENDFAVGLSPNPPKLVSVETKGAMALRVTFADGTTGDVIFEPSHLTGVFAVLKDERIFRQVHIECGAVTWPGDLDLAPDAMYQAIRQNGSWHLH
jgi:hypothetical protein